MANLDATQLIVRCQIKPYPAWHKRTKSPISSWLYSKMPGSSNCLLQLTSTSTRIHIMALDGLINVNSLFTVALFLGLTTSPGFDISPQGGQSQKPSCVATNRVAEQLVEFHVYSFSSFLFSSLIALALKQAIRITQWPGGSDCCDARSIDLGHINRAALRAGILVSGAGSVSGCGFLMMALVNLVQIKLGTVACGSCYTLAAIIPLVILVPSALIIYVGLVFYSFKR